VARGMPPACLVSKEPPSMGMLPLTAGLQANHDGSPKHPNIAKTMVKSKNNTRFKFYIK
jgi:hypothetical protein